jgi:hypothetical protein
MHSRSLPVLQARLQHTVAKHNAPVNTLLSNVHDPFIWQNMGCYQHIRHGVLVAYEHTMYGYNLHLCGMW